MPPRPRQKATSSPASAPTRELVTRAEMARRKGVSRPSVTEACRPGGPLEGALVGQHIDAQHADAIAWLAEPVRGPDGSAGPAPTREEMLRLTARKRTAEARKIEIQNAEKLKTLISRELVQTHVIALIDSAFSQLFRDAAPTIARRAMEMTRANQTAEDILAMTRETMTKHLEHVQSTAVHALRGAT